MRDPNLNLNLNLGAPASTPTQVDRNSREVVSVGLRSCASIARRSSTRNCVTQLRARAPASVHVRFTTGEWIAVPQMLTHSCARAQAGRPSTPAELFDGVGELQAVPMLQAVPSWLAILQLVLCFVAQKLASWAAHLAAYRPDAHAISFAFCGAAAATAPTAAAISAPLAVPMGVVGALVDASCPTKPSITCMSGGGGHDARV